jgi:hypothetical protein
MGLQNPISRGGATMFVELVCSCTASITVDLEKNREDAGWLLINRFTNAHIACGLVSPLLEQRESPTKPFNIDQEN